MQNFNLFKKYRTYTLIAGALIGGMISLNAYAVKTDISNLSWKLQVADDEVCTKILDDLYNSPTVGSTLSYSDRSKATLELQFDLELIPGYTHILQSVPCQSSSFVQISASGIRAISYRLDAAVMGSDKGVIYKKNMSNIDRICTSESVDDRLYENAVGKIQSDGKIIWYHPNPKTGNLDILKNNGGASSLCRKNY